ncbi:MAG: hypothetical protein WC455_13225 [Dehalococcoidia bacterium]
MVQALGIIGIGMFKLVETLQPVWPLRYTCDGLYGDDEKGCAGS